MDEVKIWNKDRGLYHPKDLLDYQSYDEKTLFSLVQSGDLKAITVLGQKKMDQKQYQDAKLIYVDGAIRGSIPSLQKLSEIGFIMMGAAFKDGNLEAANNFQLETLVWNSIADKRGQQAYFKHYAGLDFSSTIPAYFKTPEGQKQLNAAIDEEYRRLQSLRLQNGLGDFDNSIPSEAWERMKSIDKQYYDPVYGKYNDKRLSKIYE